MGAAKDHRVDSGSSQRGCVLADGRVQTLREVAGTLALSAERVRQIEEGALEKLGAAQGTG